MDRQLNRVKPQLPVGAVKTYQAVAVSDETVVAACQSVGCDAYRLGWDTVVDESTDLGQRQASFIRTRSGRSFRELRTEAGLTAFRFDSGQRCFADHRTRPAVHLVRGGDHRANTGLIRSHVRVADWVEDFAEHQDRLADRTRQG
jgi:hypothetical protein